MYEYWIPPTRRVHLCLDAKGYIQDENGIPSIYHMRREYKKCRFAIHLQYWWLRDGDGFG